MDPAVFFNQYIFEVILQYIPVKELISLTTINKSWYKAVTSNSALMKNFYLGIRGDWIDDRDFDSIVACSKRNFRKIILSDTSKIIEDVYAKILMTPSQYLTTVEIFDLTIDSICNFERLLKTFESSVKNLTISNVTTTNLIDKPFQFDGKNLVNLKISFCSMDVTVGMLKSAKKLTSLELQHSRVDDGAVKYLKDMPTLKKLEMRSKWFEKFFQTSNKSQIQFQLTELNIACTDHSWSKISIDKEFLEFLENQHSLENVNLSEWCGLAVVDCIFKKPKMKEFAIFICPFFRWRINELPKSLSMRVMDVRTLDVIDEMYNLIIMLAATPNLREVKLRSINEPLAYFMKTNLKKLEKISLVHSSVSDQVKEALPHVEFV